MKRNYISPEYDYSKVFGTYNMREESTFFGSKMLEIEDMIEIHNQGIIYYQNKDNEQIDLSIETSIEPIVYSTSDDKKLNHELIIDDSQTDSQKNILTKYIMNINIGKIFTNYIFSTLKQYRTFEGISNNMCSSGDINRSINEYINNNILSRYDFNRVELFIKYFDIKDQDIRRFNNTWSSDISSIATEEFKFKRMQTKKDFDNSNIIVMFNQEKSSQSYTYEYYFKLFWTKR